MRKLLASSFPTAIALLTKGELLIEIGERA
jgi:hypothetical protein